jgi:RimJ/RimL family protein N-acetyltransferase
MHNGVPVLETSRLILRPPQSKDFDAYAGFMADERSARYIGGVQARPDAWRGFCQIAGAWSLQGFSMFSVISKADGRWIGRVGPWMPEGWPGTEIGWGILRALCNEGYATEAAIAATNWAFASLGWDDVIHVISPENDASIAVAKKLGSRNRGRGQLPSPYQDSIVDIWGQTRAEWESRHAERQTRE